MDRWVNIVTKFFLDHSGSSMAALTTATMPRVNKTNGLKGKDKKTFDETFGPRIIVKVANRLVSIGNRYSNSLQNRLDKEETDSTYKPEPRKWGERISNSPLFTYHESIYLEYFYLNANSKKSTHKYVWLDNGVELTNEELIKAKETFNLDPAKKVSKKQSDLGLTDENNVIINQVKVENIVSIRAFGHSIDREGIDAEAKL